MSNTQRIMSKSKALNHEKFRGLFYPSDRIGAQRFCENRIERKSRHRPAELYEEAVDASLPAHLRRIGKNVVLMMRPSPCGSKCVAG